MTAEQMWAKAYNFHYKGKPHEAEEALEIYLKIIGMFPNSDEAGYAKVQLCNLKKSNPHLFPEEATGTTEAEAVNVIEPLPLGTKQEYLQNQLTATEALGDLTKNRRHTVRWYLFKRLFLPILCLPIFLFVVLKFVAEVRDGRISFNRGPSHIVQSFLKAANSKDTNEAEQYLSYSLRQRYDWELHERIKAVCRYGRMKRYIIRQEAIDNDRARIDIKIIFESNTVSLFSTEEGPAYYAIVVLERINNDWKITRLRGDFAEPSFLN